jgi:hypothetical protein
MMSVRRVEGVRLRLLPWLPCVAALALAGLGPTMGRARAQEDAPPSSASAGTPTGASKPRPGVGPIDVLDVEGPEGAGPALPAPWADAPPAMPARVVMGPLEVMRESIFGAASADDWHPLSLRTFFREGWDEPFVRSPAGTNGAPKQNWFGAADGVFVRLNATTFNFTDRLTANNGLLITPVPWAPAKPKGPGNQYYATNNLYIPLNQRLELLVVAPFIASNTNAKGHYVGNFGDLTFSERFRLIEQRNFSMQAVLTERTPTGQTVNGNDINFITPSLEFWCNIAPRWVLRGSTGINIDTGRHTATSVYFNNVAVGRYLTTKDAAIFKELVVHLSVSTLSDVLGRKDYISDVYLGPGLRFGLDGDQKWYALGHVLIPVSGPHPYDWQLGLALVRNY